MRWISAECVRYDRLITELGGIDLQLLGLGNTGHIGFNEPNESFDKMTHKVTLKQKTIQDNSRFFKSIDEVPKYAVTMGMKAIMQAKKILHITGGENINLTSCNCAWLCEYPLRVVSKGVCNFATKMNYATMEKRPHRILCKS